MYITKILETSIDLFTAQDIYAVDVKQLLIRKLTERYKNRCYASMLILDILEIIRYSDRTLVDNRLDGGAYINVEFKVSGIIYVKGEVVQGCKVVNVSNSGVIIDHQYAAGMVIPDTKKKVIGVIKKDQRIPVIVEDVRYNVGKAQQITMRCYPYTPIVQKPVYYNITEILSPEDTDKVEDQLKLLNEEVDKHEKIKTSKPYAFFTQLVYPYKTIQKFELSPINAKFKPMRLDLKDILTIRDSMCITASDFANEEFLQVSNVHTEKAENIIMSPLYPAISELISKRLSYLVTLRSFVEEYDTTEKNQEMLAYWKVCMSLKV